MIPAPFAYHRPRSLDETFGLLAYHGEDARHLIRYAALPIPVSVTMPLSPIRTGTGSLLTRRWREADSNFQFLGLGRAFLYRLGVTAPFLASSRNASGTAFVASTAADRAGVSR